MSNVPHMMPRDGSYKVAGVEVWRKDSPIFSSGLCAERNESEWRRVMADPVCVASFGALIKGMLSEGYELRASRETPAAKAAREFGWAAMEALQDPWGEPGLMPLLETVPRALTEGWLPFQLLWETGHVAHGGKHWPSIRRVVDQWQEYFHATLDGRLAFQGGGRDPGGAYNKEQLFDLSMYWSCFQIGSLRSPHGAPLAGKLWPSWYVKGQHAMWRDRTARAQISGTPVIEEGFGPAGRPMESLGTQEGGRLGDVTDSSIKAALDQAAAIFDEHGWVFIPRGWKLNQLTNPGAVNAWAELIAYHDMRMRLIIEGQHLTAEQDKTGSYAASKTQESTKTEYVQALATACAGWLTGLVKRILQYNFQVEPEDLPRWHFGVMDDSLDREDLNAFLGAEGATVDGLAVAKSWKIPVPAGTTAMVLSTRPAAAPAPASTPFAALGERLVRLAGGDELAATWERVNRLEDDLATEQLAAAGPAYSAHMADLEDSVLTATGGGGELDPKA